MAAQEPAGHQVDQQGVIGLQGEQQRVGTGGRRANAISAGQCGQMAGHFLRRRGRPICQTRLASEASTIGGTPANASWRTRTPSRVYHRAGTKSRRRFWDVRGSSLILVGSASAARMTAHCHEEPRRRQEAAIGRPRKASRTSTSCRGAVTTGRASIGVPEADRATHYTSTKDANQTNYSAVPIMSMPAVIFHVGCTSYQLATNAIILRKILAYNRLCITPQVGQTPSYTSIGLQQAIISGGHECLPCRLG